MKYLSVCSGIEAASVAWRPLGWKPVAFSEIEPFPCAVLAHHYPDVPNLGDMTKHKEWPDEILADADVIVGGSPCQSFSIAGKRLSLKDERGNLAITFINIINEADEKRSKTGRSPVVCVWENVPGVLSTKDNAFGCFLGALSGEDVALEPPGGKWKNAGCVFGPTRTIAWRILDAQYFGVPQRRRRVFVVASARDGFDPRQVLFESEGVRRDSPPRRETREDIAGSTGDGIARCISAGEAQRQDLDNETYVTHSLRADGFDASEDGTGRGTPLVPVVGALACNTGPNGHDAGNFACNQAVDAGHVLPVVRCQECGEQFYDQYGTGIGTLAPYECPRCGEEKRIVPVAFDLSGRDGGAMPEGAHDTANIRAASGGSSRSYIPTASAVRRLTPRECERLQGFPDVQKYYTILVCKTLSGHQNNDALAALRCLKLPSNVWSAGDGEWQLSAEAAAQHSSTSHRRPAPPVALDVLIDLERQVVRLHSAGKSLSLAGNAGEKGKFPLPTGIESFARLIALLTHAWALATPDGKAGLQASIKPFSHPLSGSGIVISCGREIEEHASDAVTAIKTANHLFMSTTLPSGLDTESLLSTLQTLSCCVLRAIIGFIPETTSSASCFAVRLTTTQGYTAVPCRGKPAADGPRYRALGNSMAVPVMRWLGERIAMVDGLTQEP